MKKIMLGLFLVLFVTSSYAGPSSILGAQPLSESTEHYVGVGWPSIAYEWWHAGSPDWAIGAELVYGDWSGEFSNVDVGFAINVPFRWQMHQSGKTSIGFKLTPGAMIGDNDAPGGDQVVGAFRGEVGVPISIDISHQISLITGVSVPASVVFAEGVDAYLVLPIMPRLGVELKMIKDVSPFLLIELGPTLAVGDFGVEMELGLRSWIGTVF